MKHFFPYTQTGNLHEYRSKKDLRLTVKLVLVRKFGIHGRILGECLLISSYQARL